MTDGRIYTPEDEIDSKTVELREARWRLNTLERAPKEGRWCNTTIAWIDAVANQKTRIAVLEQELAGVIADQIAQAEGHTTSPNKEKERSESHSQPLSQHSPSPAPLRQPTTRQTPTK